MQHPDDDSASPYAGLSSRIRTGKSAAAHEYENRPPSLCVVRRQNGAKLRIGGIHTLVRSIASSFRASVEAQPFTVELDGQSAGTLLGGEALQIDVSPGGHSLRIVTPLSKSAEASIKIENGQRFKYSCFCTMAGISLMRDD
jgi:hypothetical protein